MKVVDLRNATRVALEADNDDLIQDYDILDTINREILNLENFLSTVSPEWTGYGTTSTISVTSGIWSYTYSQDKIPNRARAAYSGTNNEEWLDWGRQPYGARYSLERIGNKIYVHPVPYEAFTITLYERDTYEDNLPTKYQDDLTNASAPAGFPFWAESYMRARVIAQCALICSKDDARRFGAIYQVYTQEADRERVLLVDHATQHATVQGRIEDAWESGAGETYSW